MSRYPVPGLVVLIAILITAPANAQEGSAGPCGDPAYQQFDFWLGEWEVEANSSPAGHSRITRILGGCVILEEWESVGGGFAGKSFNRFDATDGLWHQHWVDNQGTELRLKGTRKDNQMILSGETTTADGSTLRNRITWTANEDGTVRQVWENSSDEGENWSVVFDGLYRPTEN